MKRILMLAAALLLLLCVPAGCSGAAVTAGDLSGKTYVWEKEGFGSDFTVTLNEDGTYLYYAGALSSYIGEGRWTLDSGVVTLAEDKELCGYDNVFRFAAGEGELVFISEGSDDFMYVDVQDGDKFVYSPDADPLY